MPRNIRGMTEGRKRVEMKKIENEAALQVTFSKRRSGLIKKAVELSILCGTELGVFLFSPGGRVYSFGSPDAFNIMNRFLNDAPAQPNGHDTKRGVLTRAFASELMDITQHRDLMIKRRRELTRSLEACYHMDESKLDAEQLSQRVARMEKFRELVVARKIELESSVSQNNLSMIPTQANLLNSLGSHNNTVVDGMPSSHDAMNMMFYHNANNINMITPMVSQQLVDAGPSSFYQGEVSAMDMMIPNPNYADMGMGNLSQLLVSPMCLPDENMVSQIGQSSHVHLDRGQGSSYSNSMVGRERFGGLHGLPLAGTSQEPNLDTNNLYPPGFFNSP